MTEQQIGTALGTALLIAVAYIFWRIVIVRCFIFAFRHALFSIRRELFLLWTQRGFDRRNCAYTMLRTRLNLAIEHAHAITAWRILLTFALRMDRVPDPYREKAEMSLRQLPQDVQERFAKWQFMFGLASARLVAFRSPVLALLLVGVLLVSQVAQLIGHAVGKLRIHCRLAMATAVFRAVAIEVESVEASSRRSVFDSPAAIGA